MVSIDTIVQWTRLHANGPIAAMNPCIHVLRNIIVKNGRAMRLGVVDTAADRQIAEVRAREVTGVFEVENGLIVAR